MSTYQKQALQTLSPADSKLEGIQHAGFGLMTEMGEILDTYKRHRYYKVPLDKKNLIEEVGDVLWYIALGYHFLDIVMPEHAPNANPELTMFQGPIDTDVLLGKMAKSAANYFCISMLYKEDWNEEFLDWDLDRLYFWLGLFVKQELGTTLEECAEANLTKLQKRYPDKTFTTQAALNRDTEAELSHIKEPI